MAALLATATCHAESGSVVVLPPSTSAFGPPATATLSGMTLEVDSRWPCQYGYRPVRFTFRRPVPAPADASITVAYSMQVDERGLPDVTVEKDIDFPAGAQTVTLTLPAPQLTSTQAIGWTVWFDGVRDPELSAKRAFSTPQVRQLANRLQILRPSVRTAATGGVLGTLASLQRQLSQQLGMPTQQSSHPLPDRWLLYSGVDVVQLTAAELSKTAESEPQTIEALRDWITTGGALWVENTGDRFQQLPDISQALQLQDALRLLGKADQSGPSEETPEWNWVELRTRTSNNGTAAFAEQARSNPAPPSQPKRISSEGWFAEAELGLGRITAFPNTWPTRQMRLRGNGATPSETRRQEAFAGKWRQHAWVQRHGLAPDGANVDFATLLPPGAGAAPITLFRVLITLFVLVAGPVNLWVLSRQQRSHLMVLTVPLTAIAITAGLLAYALLSDGFGVTARSRSVTMLDQRRGEQTTWARTCYYAGMAPAGGLAMPSDVAVYPILPGWNDSNALNRLERERTVTWTPDKQLLGGGWLPARAATQYLTVQATESPARIDFQSDDATLTATNQLGADLTLLFAYDEAGQFWLAEQAGNGEETPMQQVELLEAITAVRELVAKSQPQAPAGLDGATSNSILEEQRRQRERRMRRQLGIDYASNAVSNNLLNRTLDRLIGADGSRPLALAPRTYVAISNTSDLVAFGVPDVDESESFHVVIGAW